MVLATDFDILLKM